MTINRPVAVFLAVFAAGAIVLAAGCDRTGSTGSSVPPAVLPAAPSAAAPAPVPPGLTEPPLLLFDYRTFDFGEMLETERRTARFPFFNAGGRVLVIRDIKTSCGCTVATLDQRRFEPGESGALTVVFDPSAPSWQRKTVTVVTNSAESVIRLTVSATVLPFVVIEPRGLMLGEQPFRTEIKRTLSVSPTGSEFELLAVRTNNAFVTARARGGGDPDDRYLVDVTVSPDAPWGQLAAWVEIDVRGRPRTGAAIERYTARVRVQCRLFGEIRAEPTALRYGVDPGQSFERRIRLSRVSGRPFDIIETTLDFGMDDAAVRVEKIGPATYELVLNATAGRRPGRLLGSVLVRTDVAGEERLVVPVVGIVRARTPG